LLLEVSLGLSLLAALFFAVFFVFEAAGFFRDLPFLSLQAQWQSSQTISPHEEQARLRS